MLITTKNNSKKEKSRGQSLVEMAIVAPILVFMLIGLYEVGALLWGYMTLLNVDREATRFSTIAGALDFSQPPAATLEENYEQIGYQKVITHATRSNAGQLKLEQYLADVNVDDPNATIIISHIVVDTRQPCNSYPPGNQVEDCFETIADCEANEYTKDDLVAHPDMPGYEYLRYTYPTQNSIHSSKFDAATEADRLKADNNKFNCNLWKKLGANAQPEWSGNSAITVEMFYEKPQVLGFPLFSWLLNPFPLYVQTTMRIDSDDYSPCELFPIIVCESVIQSMQNGSEQNILSPGTCGRPSGQYGWVSWNNSDQSEDYLLEEFTNPRTALNDFTDPYQPSDHKLNAGDYVQGLTGVTNSDDIRDTLNRLKEKPITIPVYDNIAGSGANGTYHITGFAEIKIRSINLPVGQGGSITAILSEYPVTDVCLGN